MLKRLAVFVPKTALLILEGSRHTDPDTCQELLLDTATRRIT